MFVPLGEYKQRNWFVEDWWKPQAPQTIIPGVSNQTVTTVAATAGTGLIALAAAWAALKYFK